MDDKNPPIVAQAVGDNFEEKFWSLHSDGSVMIHESIGEFIDIVYLADCDCDEKMIKAGLTQQMISEIKRGNYESREDERNEEDAKTELGIFVDRGQDIKPGEMYESEWVVSKWVTTRKPRTKLDSDGEDDFDYDDHEHQPDDLYQ